jgi:hypothetical protein
MLATTERRAWREAHAASRRDDPVCVRPSSPTTACVACKAGSRRGAAWVALACDSPYDHDSRHLSAGVRSVRLIHWAIPSAGHARISFVYGIAITMYFYDHEPPHFHANTPSTMR